MADTLPSGMKYQKIQVECRSGYKANECPVAFVFEGDRLEVSETVDRWYEGGIDPEKPVMDYFKIKTDDGRTFILMYAAHLDQWFIRC